MQRILDKYNHIFATGKYDVGIVKNFEATIKLTENKFIARKPYRCSINDMSEIETQIEALLKAKLIEESSSPNGAPVNLAFKKDEGRRSRLCIDYREMNKIVVPESQPFPRINDLVLGARDCTYFTKLDVNLAF